MGVDIKGAQPGETYTIVVTAIGNENGKRSEANSVQVTVPMEEKPVTGDEDKKEDNNKNEEQEESEKGEGNKGNEGNQGGEESEEDNDEKDEDANN